MYKNVNECQKKELARMFEIKSPVNSKGYSGMCFQKANEEPLNVPKVENLITISVNEYQQLEERLKYCDLSDYFIVTISPIFNENTQKYEYLQKKPLQEWFYHSY